MPYKYAAVAVVLLLLSTLGVAQGLPDAPSATGVVFPSAQLVRPTRRLTPIAATKPLVDPNVADASYWASTSALFATTFLNVELTAHCSQQYTCLTQIAPRSARGKLYAYTLPTDIFVSFVSYKLKSRAAHMWILPQLVLTGANLFSAGRSYGRIQ